MKWSEVKYSYLGFPEWLSLLTEGLLFFSGTKRFLKVWQAPKLWMWSDSPPSVAFLQALQVAALSQEEDLWPFPLQLQHASLWSGPWHSLLVWPYSRQWKQCGTSTRALTLRYPTVLDPGLLQELLTNGGIKVDHCNHCSLVLGLVKKTLQSPRPSPNSSECASPCPEWYMNQDPWSSLEVALLRLPPSTRAVLPAWANSLWLLPEPSLISTPLSLVLQSW